MATRWKSPIYRLRSRTGKEVVIDVTTSINAALQANSVLAETIIPLFLARGVRRVLDFGAGALRNTIALLPAGFEVCAVEFEEAYNRPMCREARSSVEDDPRFSALIWPRNYLNDRRKFDAALLCYVLQTMPVPQERDSVIRSLRKKLAGDAYLVYMSRFHQFKGTISPAQRVSDGYFMWPRRDEHSFYREFETQETHDMFARHGFTALRSLARRGTEQMILYGRGNASWP